MAGLADHTAAAPARRRLFHRELMPTIEPLFWARGFAAPGRCNGYDFRACIKCRVAELLESEKATIEPFSERSRRTGYAQFSLYIRYGSFLGGAFVGAATCTAPSLN
ncbi:hypothetical protein N657DRAFT_74251 [Parathielavia appendiculata]|uniref:Uncharacterized protein n=1 Tax=Parathielavia appendiculata TaxID=2587402 RepID=A0AAN6UAX8_9PEZI|nr:hypothetical protein N657DRAFT_74251 [Parathielavia appendiculata]